MGARTGEPTRHQEVADAISAGAAREAARRYAGERTWPLDGPRFNALELAFLAGVRHTQQARNA